MQLDVPVIDSSMISHHIESKSLSVEASSLYTFTGFGRLYDDACDVGLALYNSKLGTTTRWVFSCDRRDAEGDLVDTILVPTQESMAKFPKMAGYQLLLIND